MKRVISLLVACCLLLTMVPLPARADYETDYQASEWEVIKLTNRERYRNGLDPLTTQELLFKAADIRADEIGERMDHIRPDGSDFSTVFFDVGYAWMDADENIAAGRETPAAVVSGWMGNPDQRKLILDPAWAHLGVGREGTDHWVQLFSVGWECAYTGLELNTEYLEVERGTALDDLQLWATVSCAYCGECYLPILPEYCAGYDPGTPGVQTVTVTAYGLTDTLEIRVLGEEPDIEYGDVSGDGEVNTLDLVILRQYLADWEVEVDPAPADVNANGTVDTLDLIILRQYLADWDVTLGPQD